MLLSSRPLVTITLLVALTHTGHRGIHLTADKLQPAVTEAPNQTMEPLMEEVGLQRLRRRHGHQLGATISIDGDSVLGALGAVNGDLAGRLVVDGSELRAVNEVQLLVVADGDVDELLLLGRQRVVFSDRSLEPTRSLLAASGVDLAVPLLRLGRELTRALRVLVVEGVHLQPLRGHRSGLFHGGGLSLSRCGGGLRGLLRGDLGQGLDALCGDDHGLAIDRDRLRDLLTQKVRDCAGSTLRAQVVDLIELLLGGLHGFAAILGLQHQALGIQHLLRRRDVGIASLLASLDLLRCCGEKRPVVDRLAETGLLIEVALPQVGLGVLVAQAGVFLASLDGGLLKLPTQITTLLHGVSKDTLGPTAQAV